MGNCFIKSNVDFTAASGWLQRLVRRYVNYGNCTHFKGLILIATSKVSKEKRQCEYDAEHADSARLSSEYLVDAIFPNSVTACGNCDAVSQGEEREHQKTFFFSLRHKRVRFTSNKEEISHGRVSWQTR